MAKGLCQESTSTVSTSSLRRQRCQNPHCFCKHPVLSYFFRYVQFCTLTKRSGSFWKSFFEVLKERRLYKAALTFLKLLYHWIWPKRNWIQNHILFAFLLFFFLLLWWWVSDDQLNIQIYDALSTLILVPSTLPVVFLTMKMAHLNSPGWDDLKYIQHYN